MAVLGATVSNMRSATYTVTFSHKQFSPSFGRQVGPRASRKCRGAAVQKQPHRLLQSPVGNSCSSGNGKDLTGPFAPVSINAVPGTRLKEDMLVVVLANDAGWGVAKNRAMAIRELAMVPADDHAAARAQRGLDRLSAHHELPLHMPKRFQAADMPQHRAILTREQAGDGHVPRQTGLQPDQAALRAAYPQCRLALGRAADLHGW